MYCFKRSNSPYPSVWVTNKQLTCVKTNCSRLHLMLSWGIHRPPAGDLRRHRCHYDVIVVPCINWWWFIRPLLFKEGPGLHGFELLTNQSWIEQHSFAKIECSMDLLSSIVHGSFFFSSSHYNGVIMSMMASQITSLKVVYSTFTSAADQRKHQSSASLAFVWGIHRDQWISCTKGQSWGKCFHLMTSSWKMKLLPHKRVWYDYSSMS